MSNTTISESTVTVYSKMTCPFCVRAKQLLKEKGVDFQEIEVSFDRERHEEMMRLSGQRTVPQIWIGNQHVGGCDDLFHLERQGVLDDMLATLSS